MSSDSDSDLDIKEPKSSKQALDRGRNLYYPAPPQGNNRPSPNDPQEINLPVPSDRSGEQLSRARQKTNSSPLLEKMKLLDCLESLKFDPTKDKPAQQSESNASVRDLLGLDPNSSSKSRPRIEQTLDKTGAWLSSQPELRNGEKPENKVPGYATVIKEWGKRPLLVESEAPWTRRNRMYLNAVKALEKAKQNQNINLVNNNNNNNGLSSNPIPPQFGLVPGPQPGVIYQTFMPPGQPMPQQQPPLGYPTLPQNNNSPFLAGISPPPPPDASSRPVAVALESPYPYQQEVVVPIQAQPPTLMYGHLNSGGMWVPLIQQVHQLQHQQFQQLQQQQAQQQQQQQQQPTTSYHYQYQGSESSHSRE